MAESVNVTSTVLDKKLETYHWDAKDYVAENELTITITLAEYRELVKAVATKQHDIDRANADKYERDAENKRLKEEVDKLTGRLYEQARLCELNARKVSTEG